MKPCEAVNILPKIWSFIQFLFALIKIVEHSAMKYVGVEKFTVAVSWYILLVFGLMSKALLIANVWDTGI